MSINWWLANKATEVKSADEYYRLIDSELKGKFVVLDFYMQ